MKRGAKLTYRQRQRGRRERQWLALIVEHRETCGACDIYPPSSGCWTYREMRRTAP